MYLKRIGNLEDSCLRTMFNIDLGQSFMKMHADGSPVFDKNGRALFTIMTNEALQLALLTGEFTHVED